MYWSKKWKEFEYLKHIYGHSLTLTLKIYVYKKHIFGRYSYFSV